MTIAQVKQGIVDALYSGVSGITIYTESVKQNLNTPCVIVKCLNPSHGVDLGRRYSKALPWVIQFIPGTDGSQIECDVACEAMFEALENITVGDHILHGLNMSGETSDGVLTFRVDYDLFMIREQTETDMESFEVNIGVN